VQRTAEHRVFGADSWSFEVVRVTLGLILIIGGIKIAFPPDPARLAAAYIDPAKGWISPLFADQITGRLGLEIATFLHYQGLLEIGIGVLLAAGLFTRPVAIVTAALFWSFTVANPVAGQIRLSRDLTLMLAASAVAIIGPGPWSLDLKLWPAASRWRGSRDAGLLLLRLGVALALITSALFTEGVFANPLNITLPPVLVFALGVGLGLGLAPRVLMAVIGTWLAVLLPLAMADQGLYLGLDALKRELGFVAAALCYAIAGPDRWIVRRPGKDVQLAGFPNPRCTS
jgi:uncharacterized membrane protein YphA (DoxX/SURF4 family)